jgi:hypothetical protein
MLGCQEQYCSLVLKKMHFVHQICPENNVCANSNFKSDIEQEFNRFLVIFEQFHVQL